MAKLDSNLKLQSDLLNEGIKSNQREVMIHSMVATARSRQRRSVALRAVSAAALVCLSFFHFSFQPDNVDLGTSVPTHLIQTPIAPFTSLKTGDLPAVSVLSTHAGSVTFLTTRTSHPDLRELSERELMQMLSGLSVALVKQPDGNSKLTIFQANAQ